MLRTEIDNLYKVNDGTFVFDDPKKVAEYKRTRNIHEQRENDVKDLRSQINTLTSDIHEIKSMLADLCKGSR